MPLPAKPNPLPQVADSCCGGHPSTPDHDNPTPTRPRLADALLADETRQHTPGTPAEEAAATAAALSPADAQAAPVPTVMEIDRLDFAYDTRPVLSNISLSISAGTTLGLIGPNGGGKTTLLQLILGQRNPTRGRITIAGMSPRQAVGRGDVIGYLPQTSTTDQRLPMTARQTVRLGLAGKTGLLRNPSRDDLAFVEHVLDLVGIADQADRPISTLSGGQLQRVMIARALAPRPQLLLLDEPTTGIDRAGLHRFIEFVVELQKTLRLTLIMVSHDLRAVCSLADRIACLSQTLHYHDVPHRLPPDLVYDMFACDLEALGLERRAGSRQWTTNEPPSETARQ